MAFDLPTFLTRLTSALVFAIVMLAGLLLHEWAFIALFFLVNMLALMEYVFLLEKILGHSFTKAEKANFIFLGILSFLLVCTLQMSTCTNSVHHFLHQNIFFYLGMWIGGLLLFFYFKKSNQTYFLLTGIGYISLSLGLLVQIRYMSLIYPLVLILMIWMNDSLAYLCGSFFGKRPLMPSVSPKKTIEGTLGGIFFTLILATFFYLSNKSFSLSNWLSLALIASVIGTVGDLAESKLKRMANVKDSGSIMPGHGGALDRFDSLFIAAPFAFIYCLFFMKCFPWKLF